MVDWGDGSDPEFWGNLQSCKIRYPTTAEAANPFDTGSKTIVQTHTYA